MRLLAGLAAAVFLWGCAEFGRVFGRLEPVPPRVYRQLQTIHYYRYTPAQESTDTQLILKLVSDRAANDFCGSNSLACSMRLAHECHVTAPAPQDFNDKDRLAILGHEILHCASGDHE